MENKKGLIAEYSKSLELIRVYPSVQIASSFNEYTVNDMNQCISGSIPFLSDKFFINYSYKITNEELITTLSERNQKEKFQLFEEAIVSYNTDGTYLDTYFSYKEASLSLNEPISKIKAMADKKRPRNDKVWLLYMRDFPTKAEQITEVNRLLTHANPINKNQTIYKYDKHKTLIDTYSSIEEALNQMNISMQVMSNVLKGNQASTKGHIFLSDIFHPTENLRQLELDARLEKTVRKDRENRPVIKFNSQGQKISEYSSVDEAERKTLVPRKYILSTAKGQLPHYKMVIFIFKDEQSTLTERIKYFTRERKRKEYKKRKPEKVSKKILQYDLDKNLINTFNTSIEASTHLNISQGSISQCVLGNTLTTKGYIFLNNTHYDSEKDIVQELERRIQKKAETLSNKRIKKSENKVETEIKATAPKPKQPSQKIDLINILHYDLEGNFIGKYADSREVFKQTGDTSTTIKTSIKNAKPTSHKTIYLLEKDFQTEEQIQDEIKRIVNLKKEKKKLGSKAIVQLTTKGEYLNRFESIKEASKELHASVTTIRLSCVGEKPGGIGFVFLYEDEFETKESMKEEVLRRFA